MRSAAFAFAVGFLGLVESGILSSAANDIFIAACFGIGAVGLLIGGLWEYRSGELFGGTFGLAASAPAQPGLPVRRTRLRSDPAVR